MGVVRFSLRCVVRLSWLSLSFTSPFSYLLDGPPRRPFYLFGVSPPGAFFFFSSPPSALRAAADLRHAGMALFIILAPHPSTMIHARLIGCSRIPAHAHGALAWLLA